MIDRWIQLAVAVSFTSLSAGCIKNPETTEFSRSDIDARLLMSRHDPHERLATTQIRKVGVLTLSTGPFDVYDLNFVNPISHHGMQRVAIIQGSHFVGSYTTDGAKITILDQGLQFTSSYDGSTDVMSITNGKFPTNFLIDGEVRPLEPNI